MLVALYATNHFWHHYLDIFGVQVMCFVLDWTGRLGLTFTTGLFIRFAAKREK